MTTLGVSRTVYRGATVRFRTTFYDFDDAIDQPSSAVVRIISNAGAIQEIAMTAPAGDETAWTALLDTRGMTPGPLTWSIHTSGSPVSVEDGSFILSANTANAVTFV